MSSFGDRPLVWFFFKVFVCDTHVYDMFACTCIHSVAYVKRSKNNVMRPKNLPSSVFGTLSHSCFYQCMFQARPYHEHPVSCFCAFSLAVGVLELYRCTPPYQDLHSFENSNSQVPILAQQAFYPQSYLSTLRLNFTFRL